MRYDGWRKWLVAVWAIAETFLFGGLLYGWAPVVWIFKQDEIYADLCPHNSSHPAVGNISVSLLDDGNSTEYDTGVMAEVIHGRCKPQDGKFALAFTIGSALFCASAAATGYVNYSFGTRITRVIAMVIFMSGTVMFALVSTDAPWLIFSGLTCIGVGGLPLLMTNTQISNLFVNGKSTFIGFLCGAYDSSSVVQLLVKIAYENGVKSSYSYFFLTALHLMVGVSTFIFLPKTSIQDKKNDSDREEEIAEQEKSMELLTKNQEKEVYENTTIQEAGQEPVPTLRSCVFSTLFILHVFWLCLLQLRFYFFLGTVNPFLHRITEDNKEQVSYFTNVMMYTMLGGLFSSIFAGVVYDWQRRMFQGSKKSLKRRLMPAVLPLAITSGLGLLLSLLVLIPSTDVLYIVFIVMTFFRSFLYSVGTVFLSAVFPGEYFTMLYGIMIIAGGVIGFIQFAFFTWAQAYFGAAMHVDIVCVCVVALSFIHPIVQWIKCRRCA